MKEKIQGNRKEKGCKPCVRTYCKGPKPKLKVGCLVWSQVFGKLKCGSRAGEVQIWRYKTQDQSTQVPKYQYTLVVDFSPFC